MATLPKNRRTQNTNTHDHWSQTHSLKYTHTKSVKHKNKPPPEYGLHCRLAGHSALLDLDLSLFCGVLLPQGFRYNIMIRRICFKIILWSNISIFPSNLRCSYMLSDPTWRVYEFLCTCSEHGTKLKSKKNKTSMLLKLNSPDILLCRLCHQWPAQKTPSLLLWSHIWRLVRQLHFSKLFWSVHVLNWT